MMFAIRAHPDFGIPVLWFPSSLSAWGNPNFKKGGMSGIVQWADMYSPYRPKTAGDEHYKGRKATAAQDIEQIIRISLPSLLFFLPKTLSLVPRLLSPVPSRAF